MLRGCSFIYADKDSKDYNLELYFVDNSTTRFTSGGGYELMTTTLPPKSKTLLYGLDHSAEPLKFDIEILNPNGAISQDEFAEIKNWLFGQNGWQRLFIDDSDFEGLHLECLLIPKDDIVDMSGYRGLQCEVVNDSPFWYAEDKEITFTKSDFDELTNSGTNIPESGKVALTVDIETHNQDYIYPTVKFLVTSEDFNGLSRFTFNIHNDKTDYESDLCVNIGLGRSNKEFSVDCEYGTCKVDNTLIIPDLNTNYDFFYLERGENTVSVSVVTNNVYAPPSYLTIVYTPCVRVGGF